MSQFDAQMDDAMAALADVMGETVTYHPDGGSDREITAVVNRNPPAPVGGLTGAVWQLEVTVANDADIGISSADLDSKDDITVAPRQGASPARLRIRRILEQDAAAMLLAVG